MKAARILDGFKGRAAASLMFAAPGVAAQMVNSCAQADEASRYAQWRNGPPQSPGFFPLAVWWQNPPVAGHSGKYPTIAAAAVGMKLNTFIGLSAVTGGGNVWPERFGHDEGELEVIKAHKLYVIGGINTPYTENTSAGSVASVLALAKSIGAESNVIGYTAGDEPTCGGTMEKVPHVVDNLYRYDRTRVVSYNFTEWMTFPPQWLSKECAAASDAALKAVSFGSFDEYPATNPWIRYPGSDFRTVPQDSLFMQGLATDAIIHDSRKNQPIWVYIEAGGDNLGFSLQNDSFAAGVTSGSRTLTNASGWSHFTPTWIGLTMVGPGIPANAKIVSISDSTHAVMSEAATATNAHANVKVTGGSPGNADCVPSANLCVVNGNAWRPTPAQVNAEVWMSIINGANGIEYFCHDDTSDSFCMGDKTGGSAAQITQENLTYINTNVVHFARILNATTTGMCSMQHLNYATGAQYVTHACSGGNLTMSTDHVAVPGMAMLKQHRGITYLFAQSDRRSAEGVTYTYDLKGLGRKTATTLYDSNARYDQRHSSIGDRIHLSSSGQFTDVLGAHNDDYEVKIYRIE